MSELKWTEIAKTVLTSRIMDSIEEEELLPSRKIMYQFSSRGHSVAQAIVGSQLKHPHDAAGLYYRSRPFLLSLGVSVHDAFAAPMGKAGGYSNGRDIGVVCNLPSKGGPTVLPMSGDVGSQYTPSCGWAQALQYRKQVLKQNAYETAIALVHGGDASVATNGFWSALTMATTLRLPVLFYIEDNGFGISVTSDLQTPGGNIARNLSSFHNLFILEGDGTDPDQIAQLSLESFAHVRSGQGPALLRLTMPRLSGHSGQDTQAYKSPELLAEEQKKDPLPKLKNYLIKNGMNENEWQTLNDEIEVFVRAELEVALAAPLPNPATITTFRFSERDAEGKPILQRAGGVLVEGHEFPTTHEMPQPEETRINMLTAIRRTLEHELRTNSKLVLFGEDIGAKGGVHAATLGLQDAFGTERVFDTSLSEEGIIGRAVGMALQGLMPVPEIQFRKYADPATEQLNNIGSMRWRTNNRFAAPMVVRIPGGFAKCGDPWHSHSGLCTWVHNVGWQVVVPSHAEDAVGLLRTALRDNNPTIFFEHRNLLDNAWARRPYPGDDYAIPLGKAAVVQEGNDMTLVSWGALVSRCEEAAQKVSHSVEVLDLRTLMPWDKECILASVEKTRRLLIVHEDFLTAGFGAEIAAYVSQHGFFSLDAPPTRLAVPDIPIPYEVGLLNATVPTVDKIKAAIEQLMEE
ncbi:MAG: dehydrogenase E1 component subunit alpha/beta [Bdellovibrionales bacterium]|nr:dehydrogenase E1 component subunit alpha/beta [Bdellovibrionales bacterium]